MLNMPFFLVHDANDNDNDDDDDEEKAKVEGSSPRDDFLLLDFIDEKLLANVRTPHLWEMYNLKKYFFTSQVSKNRSLPFYPWQRAKCEWI